MASVALIRSNNAAIKRIARAIVDAQSQEIGKMIQWRSFGILAAREWLVAWWKTALLSMWLLYQEHTFIVTRRFLPWLLKQENDFATALPFIK